ncbi:MAG TPA: ribonuclease H-like domain-containing protein [Anaerolineales bacterium]|nr:ribonuclease H-like domain-containing protein [Anaerolineales bacterium]
MSVPQKPSLVDKLKSLGVKLGTEDLSKVPPLPQFEIDKVVPGTYRHGLTGETFVAEQTFGSDYRHGRSAIRPEAPLDVLAAWAREPRFLELPLESYAFLDTETSGLAGGTGTYAFLVGVGRFVPSDFPSESSIQPVTQMDVKEDRPWTFRLEQFFMRDPAEEAAMLERLAEFLAPTQALVTFNGKTFDAPLLTTRYSLHNIPLPFKDYAHLDLLPLARRLWRDRLPSRALKYLEENVLSAPRTVEEVPGYEIPYLYFDYLRSRDARPLKGVFYHNAMDVVAMAALLSHVSAILANPFSEAIEHGLDVVALAKLYEDLGQWDIAARLFERGLEMQLPEPDFWLAIQRLARLGKRRGDLETAVRMWETAAEQGHVYAHVELAKYYEHQRQNYAEALKWTRRAGELVSSLDIPRYMYNHWMEELKHREERLVEKIQKRHSHGVEESMK